MQVRIEVRGRVIVRDQCEVPLALGPSSSTTLASAATPDPWPPRRRSATVRAMRLAALALLFGSSVLAQTTVPPSLREVLDDPFWRGADFGLYAVDLDTGDALVELAARRRFAPASVTKLFSGAAALSAFGASHVFETKLHAVGGVDAGRVAGALVLRAAGDPNLSGRRQADGSLAFTKGDHTYALFSDASVRHAVDPLEGLDDLASQLRARGITWVREVVIDDRLFAPTAGTGSGPSRLTPIVVNDNVLDIVVWPGNEAGQAARCEVTPVCARIAVDARVTTVAADAGTEVSIERLAPERFAVRGKIALGRAPLLRIVEVDDPAAFARSLLVERLRAHGIDTPASALADNPRAELPSADAYAAPPVLAVRASPPFAEALQVILKVSHNLHAGMLPLLLATEHGERTLEAGLARQGQLLRALDVPLDQLAFGSAAGGAAADQVTPIATVALLRAMTKRADFGVWRDALPVLGVDGTLHDMVAADSPVRGKVRAKTGTLIYPSPVNGKWLLRSKALAGYLETNSGRTLAFAFFLNDALVERHADTARAGRALARLCELLHAAL